VINHRLRSTIFRKLIETGAYEAFLVDRYGCITEGSRSNVFFVRNSELYTAADGEVLSGIVRKYVLEFCMDQDIRVHFQKVKTDDMDHYEACFITGTSPGVLPVSSIGTVTMQTGHPLVHKIMAGYQDHIAAYISRLNK